MGQSLATPVPPTGTTHIRRFFFTVADIFDLFCDPVSVNHGKRGRPEHIPTQENRRRVNAMVALGWSNARMAGAMRITEPTLRKHYCSELKFREGARDRMDVAVFMKIWEGVEKGNIAAIRQHERFVERNDLMLCGQTRKPAKPDAEEKPAKVPAVGKKEAAVIAAHQPDQGTPLGELMARRQQSVN